MGPRTGGRHRGCLTPDVPERAGADDRARPRPLRLKEGADPLEMLAGGSGGPSRRKGPVSTADCPNELIMPTRILKAMEMGPGVAGR